MRKKIAVFLAAGMLLTAVPTATSCTKAPEEAPTEPQKETTAATTTTTQTEETTTETETQKEYASDIDSQMDIIVKSYDFIRSDYFVYSEVYPGTSFAVTDLNHNGRLEIIVSSIQGSGAFSLTNFYEISEDYSSIIFETSFTEDLSIILSLQLNQGQNIIDIFQQTFVQSSPLHNWKPSCYMP